MKGNKKLLTILNSFLAIVHSQIYENWEYSRLHMVIIKQVFELEGLGKVMLQIKK